MVVVNITRSRRRTTDKPTDEGLLGWSVLQDVTGVALGTVIIATSGTDGRPLPVALALLAAYVVLAVVAAQVLPIVLRHLRSEHDLFLIVSVASGLALAAAGAVWFGVPAALAAFVGGLAISNRAETAEARRRLLPFRDVFAVLFFVAVGTLIDPSALPGAVPEIAFSWRWSWSRRSCWSGCWRGSPGWTRGPRSSPSGSVRWASSATCWRGSASRRAP